MRLPELPKQPALGKVTGLFTAKTVVLTVAVGTMVVVPTTLYIAERQKNYEQPVPATGGQAKDTSKQTTLNEATPEQPATATNTQETSKPTKTTQNNGTGATQSTQSTPSTTTPALTSDQTKPVSKPILDWGVETGIDKCSPSSEGDKMRCAPNTVANFYLVVKNGTTIKSYTSNLSQYPLSGVTLTLNKVSATTLEGTVVSDRTRDKFRLDIDVTVYELAEPQSKYINVGWFDYRSDCLNTPKPAGCY